MELLLIALACGALLLASGVVARRVVERGLARTESGAALGVFRIVYAVVLECELLQLWAMEPLVARRAIMPDNEFGLRYALGAWLLTNLALLVGWRTRAAVVVGFAFNLASLSIFRHFEYHVDYVFTGVNALLLFIPVESRFSIDRLRWEAAATARGAAPPPPRRVTVLNRWMIVLLGIAFVYFDSVFFKLVSPMWTAGLGVWLPATLMPIAWTDLSPLLDQRWLMLGLGFVTVGFEAGFLALMWFRWAVPWLLLVGLGLHLGILVAFPIPWFALAMLALYVLMVPAEWFTTCGRLLRRPEPLVRFFYDEGCPLCRRTRAVLAALDVRRGIEFCAVQASAEAVPELSKIEPDELLRDVHVVTAGGAVTRGVDAYIQAGRAMGWATPLAALIACPPVRALAERVYRGVADRRRRDGCDDSVCGVPGIPLGHALMGPARPPAGVLVAVLTLLFTLQAITTTQSLGVRKLMKRMEVTDTFSGWNRFATWTHRRIGRPFFGITPHGVFMDQHFQARKHAYAVVHVGERGARTWLPITRESGLVHPYNTGRLWVEWTFFARLDERGEKAERHLANRTGHWMMSRGRALDGARFELLAKPIDFPADGWEPGCLARQIEEPWEAVAELEWEANAFHVRWMHGR